MLAEVDLVDGLTVLVGVVAHRHPVVAEHHHVHPLRHARLIQPGLQETQSCVKLKATDYSLFFFYDKLYYEVNI